MKLLSFGEKNKRLVLCLSIEIEQAVGLQSLGMADKRLFNVHCKASLRTGSAYITGIR